VLGGLVALFLLSLLGDRLLPRLSPTFEPDTGLMLPLDLDVRIDKHEFAYTLRTNHLGLRNAEVPLGKPAGARRLLLLGDEQTAGVGVDAEQTFAARLDARLAGIEVINAGRPHADPLQQARIFHHVGVRYGPDAVLLCVAGDDLGNMPWEPIESLFELTPTERTVSELLWPHASAARAKAKRRSKYTAPPEPFDFVAKIEERATKKKISAGHIAAWKRAVAGYPQLVEAAGAGRFNGNVMAMGLLWHRQWPDSLDLGQTYKEKAWANMRRVLRAVAEDASKSGSALGVVFLPERVQYAPAYHGFLRRFGLRMDPLWLTEPSRFQIALGRWCGDHGVPFLDLTEAFRKHADPAALSHTYGGELTAAGHGLVAERVAAWTPTWAK